MIKEKLLKLKNIYKDFTQKASKAKREQACEKGCGFCCKEAGSIDITTLEGILIRESMKSLTKSRQKSLTKLFQQEIMDFGKSHKIVINKMVV